MQKQARSKGDLLFHLGLLYVLVVGLGMITQMSSDYKAQESRITYDSDEYYYGPQADAFVSEYCKNASTNTLGLREKISQMIVAKVDSSNVGSMCSLGLGGVYFEAMGSKGYYNGLIDACKAEAIIPLFITHDLEGYWNPFSRFSSFPNAAEMGKMNDSEVYETTKGMARLMKEMGFNMDFAPVLDLSYGNDVWPGRAFSTDPEVVSTKAVAFIRAFEDQNILVIAKHFPGKTVSVADTHIASATAEITEDDVTPFRKAVEAGVAGVMMNHLRTTGEVDSGGRPASVSENAVAKLREFYDGLVLTDDMSMQGVDSFYQDKNQKYIDAINAGNDILLLTSVTNTQEVEGVIQLIENAVNSEQINGTLIDEAAERILETKCGLFS